MKIQPPLIAVLLLLLLSGSGCDTAPETRPMDEPLSTGAAIEADERMQRSAESLLKEKESGLQQD